MISIDDLRTGMWVAVLHSRNCPTAINGLPLKILSINLPFICVTDSKNTYPLDVRNFNFIKLSKTYVKHAKLSLVFTIQCPFCGNELSEHFEDNVHVVSCPHCGFEGGIEND